MQYQIKVDIQDVEEGELVEFAHLGGFPNGGTYDLAPERVKMWEDNTGGEGFRLEDAQFPEGVEILTDKPKAGDNKPTATKTAEGKTTEGNNKEA